MKNRFLLFFILFVVIVFSCTKKNEVQKLENEKRENSSQIIIVDSIKYTKMKNIVEKKEKSKINKIEKFGFTKGIYLTAYTVASPIFYSILDSAQAAGINTIVFDLKNMNGHIFFSIHQKGSLTRENVNAIIDIPYIVKILHRRNLRAVARVVMFHDQFTSERDSLLRPQKFNGSQWKESERRKPSWLDPSHPDVQNELLDIIDQIAKQGVDEIQLDYIRFPTQGKISEAIFYFLKEDSMFTIIDSNYVKREKSDIIENFLRRAKKICSKYEVTLTGDIFAIVAWQREVDIKATGQDIQKMTKHFDSVHPMIYSSHFNDDFGYREYIHNEPYFIVYKATKLVQRYSNKDCDIIPYIQSNPWKVNYTSEYIISQIKAVENLNANGYILWNASNKYFKTLSWLKEYYKSP